MQVVESNFQDTIHELFHFINLIIEFIHIHCIRPTLWGLCYTILVLAKIFWLFVLLFYFAIVKVLSGNEWRVIIQKITWQQTYFFPRVIQRINRGHKRRFIFLNFWSEVISTIADILLIDQIPQVGSLAGWNHFIIDATININTEGWLFRSFVCLVMNLWLTLPLSRHIVKIWLVFGKVLVLMVSFHISSRSLIRHVMIRWSVCPCQMIHLFRTVAV